MIFELLGAKAAMEEEQNHHNNASLSRAFNGFLTMIRDIRKINIKFDKYYDQSQIPIDIRRQEPCLMDPVNPYNNLLDVKKRSEIDTLFTLSEHAAEFVLRQIENGCNDLNIIFCPQLLVHVLREKDNFFLPNEGNYIVGIHNSNETWIQKSTHGIIMSNFVCRDPKWEQLESYFTVLLHTLICLIYNITMTGQICHKIQMASMSDKDTGDMVKVIEIFLDNLIGTKRNWDKGKGIHETKSITFFVPLGSPISDGIYRIACVSLDFDEKVRYLDDDLKSAIQQLSSEVAQTKKSMEEYLNILENLSINIEKD